MAWFVKDALTNSVSGPFDDAHIKSLAMTLKITRRTEVAKNREGPWYLAGKITGLFSSTSDVDDASAESSFASPHFASAGDVSVAHDTPSEENPFAFSIDSAQPKPKRRAAPPTRIQAKDKLGVVVQKLIRGAKEYSFHDDDFPALAACLRIGAAFTRVWFCVVFLLLSLFGLFLVSARGDFDGDKKTLDALECWCSLTGDDIQDYLVKSGYDLSLRFNAIAMLLGLLLHSLKFLAIMGGMELVRVILAIEKNTRKAIS